MARITKIENHAISIDDSVGFLSFDITEIKDVRITAGVVSRPNSGQVIHLTSEQLSFLAVELNRLAYRAERGAK